MDIKTLLIILIPSILSILLTAANMIFGYLREKRNKDDRAWETTEKILLSYIGEDGKYMDLHKLKNYTEFFDEVYNSLRSISKEDYANYKKRLDKRIEESDRLKAENLKKGQ